MTPLIDLRETPLDVTEVTAAVSEETHGAIALFVGTVRDHDGGKAVEALDYSAHPSALERLRQVCAEVAERHTASVAALHRVGLLNIGDIAVVVAASTPHRADAFEATRELIERLKAEVPIWKHQRFSDGTQEWVDSP